MTDVNRAQVRKRKSADHCTGLCSEGWYSEHSGVCRRAEQPGNGRKRKWQSYSVFHRKPVEFKEKKSYEATSGVFKDKCSS